MRRFVSRAGSDIARTFPALVPGSTVADPGDKSAAASAAGFGAEYASLDLPPVVLQRLIQVHGGEVRRPANSKGPAAAG
jgi:hypothetical protein